MDEFKEFINSYLLELACSFTVLVGTFIGIKLKSLVSRYLNDKTKQEVAKIVVSAVEQVCTELHGTDKLAEAELRIVNILKDKGITISTDELDSLIEDAVRSMNLSTLLEVNTLESIEETTTES